MQIKLASVMVDDQEKALRFYTEVLGFTKKADVPIGPFRWLTVSSPEGAEGAELVLEPVGFPPRGLIKRRFSRQASRPRHSSQAISTPSIGGSNRSGLSSAVSPRPWARLSSYFSKTLAAISSTSFSQRAEPHGASSDRRVPCHTAVWARYLGRY